MATVELRNIAKVFDGNVRAVDGADITIRDREFVIFVGPSGCGKSTTLRMIAGLEDITEGDLFIDGRRVNDVPPKDRDIAMVFQNYALYPHMTVHENMAFGLRMRKLPKAEIETRVREAARILDIEKLLERRPRQLSGGQRQRVAVGRAIVRQPKVFLFDEPLSNLDAKLRVQMRAELIELHERLQATMVYVTHDQVEAMTMGDKIVVMKDGRIQQIGSPLYLYNHPFNAFVAGFLGTPPMNFVDMAVVEERGRLALDEGGFRLEPTEAQAALLRPYLGRTVSFGIRPEDLPCADAPAAPSIPARVAVVEPLGADINLYATAGRHRLTARIAPHHLHRIGDAVTFAPVMEKARFFDKETELSILPAKWNEQEG